MVLDLTHVVGVLRGSRSQVQWPRWQCPGAGAACMPTPTSEFSSSSPRFRDCGWCHGDFTTAAALPTNPLHTDQLSTG